MSFGEVALWLSGAVAYLFFGYILGSLCIRVAAENRTLVPGYQRTDYEIWINWSMMLLVPITTFCRIDRYSDLFSSLGSLPNGKPIPGPSAPYVLLATNDKYYRKEYPFLMAFLWPAKIVWTVVMIILGAIVIFPLMKRLPKPRTNGGAYD